MYGDWANSGFDPQTKFPIPEFKPLEATDYFVKESSIAQTPNLMYIWQGPDTRQDSAATIAADVFNTALGLNSSKWQQALVDKGLTTYASVSYQTEKYVGPIVIYTMPNPKKLKECYKEIAKQVKMWGDEDYITDEELNTAKQVMRRSDIRQKEKPSSLPSQLTYMWCSASYEYGTDYIDNCMKVTKADIKRYVEKYITGKNYVAGMIINPEMNKETGASLFFKPNF
ncbi:MAG: insulinase family protein [Ferruginibacter sp.]